MKKLFNVGFEDIRVVDRRPFALGDLARYPLFSPEFLGFLAEAMPPARHAELVHAIVVAARKPPAEGALIH